MASSYVNNLRLNEMDTGDASGTWGTTTNTNLELIGEALGYGTEGITTNADTHTTTIADGSSDAGRAMYIKYTGTLDSACTITIGPNTMKRVHIIENATSGSQNIIISQGSGDNVTITTGTAKTVYLDGAGSGAAVVDAFAHLAVVDLTVDDDLIASDDVTLKSDSAVLGFGADTDTTLTHTDGTGLTLNGTNKLCFNDTGTYVHSNADGDIDIVSDGTAVDSVNIESGGGITLDAGTAGSGIIYEDDGTEMARLYNNSSDVILEVKVADKNFQIKGTDGSSAVTALDIDMAAEGDATFANAVYAGGNIGLDSTDFISFTDNTQMDVTINGSNEFRFESDGDFHADGDVISASTTISSDERLKENIQTVENPIDKIKQIRGVTFKKKFTGKESAGVIAQEVEKVLPSAVDEKKLPMETGDEEALWKTVKYDQLHALLIESVKELTKRVEELENGTSN
jgi:hypothetical protein